MFENQLYKYLGKANKHLINTFFNLEINTKKAKEGLYVQSFLVMNANQIQYLSR